jgi:hypothetical protein
MWKRYGYWVCTSLLVLWLVPNGVLDLMRIPGVINGLAHLGYPSYLAIILGTWKLLAVAALLHPGTRLLREWAYAGITFDMFDAFVSHVAVHDPLPVAVAPLFVLGFAAGSYFLRPHHLVLQAATKPKK